jgi:hypothetical protein
MVLAIPNRRAALPTGQQGLPQRGLVARWQLGSPNLLRWSEQFDNAVWTKDGTSTTANATTAPDGTATADKLVEAATTATHWLYQQNAAVPAGLVTLSVYVKAGERSRFGLLLNNGTDGTYGSATFNLSSGTVETLNAGIATITDVGNGWYRCTLTGTTTISSAQNWYTYLLGVSGGSTYTGDGTSGLYLWGAQLNEGSTPLPYVKTTDLQSFVDLSGNGHTLQRGSTSGADSNDWDVQTYRGSFDGVAKYAVIPAIPELMTADDFSIMAVVHHDTGHTTDFDRIFEVRDASSGFGLRVDNSNNRLSQFVQPFGGSQTTLDFSFATTPRDAPFFCGFARRGTVSTGYLGLQRDTVAVQAGAVNVSAGNSYVGRYALSSAGFWDGYIYEVLAYKVNLSPAEVAQLYRFEKAYWAAKAGIAL